MHHAAAMRLLQAVADVGRVAQDLLDRQRTFGQAVSQSLAVQELHDQVIGAVLMPDVVQGADVGVIQRGDGSRFTVEALLGLSVVRQVRRQDLDRDGAVQPRVARAIHFAHAPCAHRRDDLVGAKFGS